MKNTNEPEQWRPIPGTDGMYELSDLGRIRSYHPWRGRRTPFVVKTFWNSGAGYMMVAIHLQGTGKNMSIKTLMRDIWMDGAKDGYSVGVIDGDPKNLVLSNLAYMPGNRKPCAMVGRDGKRKAYPSIIAAAADNYMTPSGVSRRIQTGKEVDGVTFFLI